VTNFKYRGYTVSMQPVEDQSDVDDPRPEDRIGTIVILSKNYSLGDVPLNDPDKVTDYWSRIYDQIMRKLRRRWGRKPTMQEVTSCIVRLPLYVYDHSGRVYSTSPFHCEWDSWQTGTIYARIDTIRKGKLIPNPDEVKKKLQAEFDLWKYYAEGDIYEYCIEKRGEYISGSSGYLGSESYSQMRKDAKSEIDYMLTPASSQ